MGYTFATLSQAIAALALRLGDTGNVFWTQAELTLYLQEALRTRNALTNEWTGELVFSAPVSPAQTWYDVTTVANSPRVRTLQDTDLYTIMQYHLLETPAGGNMGNGSGQFTMADLSQALQRRRDELILAGKLNMARTTQASTLSRREIVADTILEIERLNWIPVTSPSGYTASVLAREDTLAFAYFQPGAENTTLPPTGFSVLSDPPLEFEVDYLPPINATWEMLAVQSGAAFNPPYTAPATGASMSIPNDLTWIAKWGAMSDLFAKGTEATDEARASYCLARYQDGMKLVMNQPWILQARLNNMRVDTPSVREMDSYSYGWEANASALSCVVIGGMDLVAPCPVPTVATGVSMTVVANAPVPVAAGDFIQCSRDVYDTILDYAQSLAFLKMGAAEVEQSKGLVKNFYMSCAEANKRIAGLGLFRDVMLAESKRMESVYASK